MPTVPLNAVGHPACINTEVSQGLNDWVLEVRCLHCHRGSLNEAASQTFLRPSTPPPPPPPPRPSLPMAQEGSQETAATIVGMLLGMAVARLVSSSLTALWLVFLSLTAFHVYGETQCVKRIM